MVHPDRPARGMLLLALLLAAVWLGNLDYRRLIRPDEGRYAEIAREMAATGDWTTPRLNGIKYFEKPPLQYWATAAAYRAFGEHEWTTRLWPALTGLAGIFLVYFAAARLFGAAAGFYSAAVLAGSTGYIFSAHFNTLDMGTTFFLTAGLAAFMLAQRPGVEPARRRGWMMACWAAASLAVLSKGLIGIVLPAGTLAVYVVLQRDPHLLRRLEWRAGLIVFLAIAAPWFVLVQLANPEFMHFFFVHEHFERFLTKVHRRPGPWWYYVPVLAVVVLPWLTMLPQAIARAWRSGDAAADFSPPRFLVVWAAFVLLFFSASSSKLPSYILPVVPALAMLVGSWLAQARSPGFAWHLIPLLLLAAAIAGSASALIDTAGRSGPHELYEAYVPWIVTGGITVVASCLLAAYYCRRSARQAAVIVLAGGWLVATQVVTSGHEVLSSWYSGYRLAQDMKPYLSDNVALYSVGTYDQTLPFYTRRTATLVAFTDELEFGLQQEPRLGLPDLDAFDRAWRGETHALAIMEPAVYEIMRQRGTPMEVVARDLRRLVVRRPASAP